MLKLQVVPFRCSRAGTHRATLSRPETSCAVVADSVNLMIILVIENAQSTACRTMPILNEWIWDVESGKVRALLIHTRAEAVTILSRKKYEIQMQI